MLMPGEIAYYAELALLVEAAAAPKPGLVDRLNNGAHRDMNIFTLMASAASLVPWFSKFAEMGAQSDGMPETELLSMLRREGQFAETDMLAVTGGVNTHRGALFSLGLICAAAGRRSEQCGGTISAEDLCACVSRITAGICEREDIGAADSAHLSHGGAVRRRYGVTGARGEAEGGFPNVREIALPVLRRLCDERLAAPNDVVLQVLLYLMASLEDTNILYRHDRTTAAYVKRRAAGILAVTVPFSALWRDELTLFDSELTERYISPGGSADLLSAALLLAFLEEPQRAVFFARCGG